MISTAFSMLYVASESFGCMLDSDGFVPDVEACADIVNSNESMLWVMCLGMFFKLLVIPNLARKYTDGDIMRFNLDNGREQVQMITGTIASIFAMFVFATSENSKDPDGLIIIGEKTMDKRSAFR